MLPFVPMKSPALERVPGALDARYVRAPSPIRFPTDELVPEGKRHLLVRTALFDLLTVAFGDRAAIGSDQFVYWNARNPRECLAPDVFVRLGDVNDAFDSWKTWERGAPHVAIEILSEPGEMVGKLTRYHELGVEELVAFDADDAAAPLRVWVRVDGDLVERALDGARTVPSTVLGVHWVAVPDAVTGLRLRAAWDTTGADLLPTLAERETLAKERERRDRVEAEERVKALEEELERERHRSSR